jgi:1,4-alpha-glucan branching enzyme
LLASALWWCEAFHIDGLRVDAVASMLYLDYSRNPGEWIPNVHGGRENLEALAFIRRLTTTVASEFPGVAIVAEESTAWGGVSAPVDQGGLGFAYKWNMGWMHDTLEYLSRDPVHRGHHQDEITFSLVYAWDERFILPLSHDEVVHGKGSLLTKMPGDRWQQFANLRLLFGLMWTHPGKKLLFMGGEFAQDREWNHDRSLDWHLYHDEAHAGVARLVRDLNHLYRATPALYARDTIWQGFQWIDFHDRANSVLAFMRIGAAGERVVVVCNLTPVVRHDYRIGVPDPGWYREICNTDAREYGGSGCGNEGGVHAHDVPAHGLPHSLELTLPPLAVVLFAIP